MITDSRTDDLADTQRVETPCWKCSNRNQTISTGLCVNNCPPMQCPRCGHDDEWIGRMCDFCGTCRICGKFSAEVSAASNLPPCQCSDDDTEPIKESL